MTVELYTKDQCQPCKLTKKVLKEEGIEFREFPIVDHGSTMKALGYLQAPVVVAGPDTHWSGFSPGRIRDLLH